jgi:hypothetical protein
MTRYRQWFDLFKGAPELRATIDKRLRRDVEIAERKKELVKRKPVPLRVAESVEQGRLIDACAKRKWLARKLVCVGHRGFPDLLVADPATKRMAFVELKVKGRSKPPTRAQIVTVELLRACGQNTYVAWGKDDALTYLERLFSDE